MKKLKLRGAMYGISRRGIRVNYFMLYRSLFSVALAKLLKLFLLTPKKDSNSI